jgi:uncharacterized membrane protein
MSSVTESIDVNVPITTAYNQWTQFEDFPRFMDGVKEVRQLDDKTLEWTAEIAGQEETWTAEITEQNPDERIAWHAIGGKENAGVVTFHHISDDTTKVTLQMDWQPEGAIQKIGDAIGSDDRQIKGDLERFKKFIESRGSETGAYRGEVAQGSSSR